ncbi:MAG TPA: hypothetical protein VJR87_04520, partial [Allosphingosinicella sp.]|nr:hypothetical protein [Allosphingosinicella sp.]
MKIRAVFLSGRRICRRLAIAALMTPMLALAVPANAQDSPAQQGPPDENSTIGPRELKRFELPGSRSNPAYQLPEPQIQAPPPPPAEVRVEPAPPSPAADTAPAPAPSIQQERPPLRRDAHHQRDRIRRRRCGQGPHRRFRRERGHRRGR